MARRHPALAVALTVRLLGLIGTPPTAVFVGKLVVLTAAVDGGFARLAVLAIVNTVASGFYYLRWIAPHVPQDRSRAGRAATGRDMVRRHRVCVCRPRGGVGVTGGVVLPSLVGLPIPV